MKQPTKPHHSESAHRACLQCDWIFRGRTNCPKCGGDTCGARWLHGSFTDDNTKTQQPWIDRKVRAYEVQLAEEAGVPPPPQHIPTDRERYLWRLQHGMTRPTDPIQIWVVSYTDPQADLEILHGVFRNEGTAQAFLKALEEPEATITKGLFYPDPPVPAPINPINPYTGDVSVLAIAKNLSNGHNKFPENMGGPKTMNNTISREEWLERCAAQFINAAFLEPALARQLAETQLEYLKGDLTECPEGAADDELSYWSQG